MERNFVTDISKQFITTLHEHHTCISSYFEIYYIILCLTHTHTYTRTIDWSTSVQTSKQNSGAINYGSEIKQFQ
jgi:hypothetical protein